MHARADSEPLSKSLDDPRLRRVLQFVDENLQDSIRLKDLAAVARLSPFHFSRAFRNAIGQSPCRFVRKRRLEKAKELVAGGMLPLAEIALICNFSSQTSFTRAFTQATGLPPGQYRRHAQAGRKE